MAGARMLYAPNSRLDHDQDFVPFDDRNYDDLRGGRSHLQVYVETPSAISRRGTFANGYQFSPPTSAQTAPAGARRWTQADQTRFDSEKKKKAVKELVTSWQDRLQLISIITTFFAGMEAQLLGVVTPDPGEARSVQKIAQASVIGLSSALVVHTFAAILSFIAAFFLVRFRVKEAQHEEVKAELGVVSRQPTSQHGTGAVNSGVATPENNGGKEDSINNKNCGQNSNGNAVKDQAQISAAEYILNDLPIFSSDPHLEQVGPFHKHEPPIVLLDHCHLLCMMLSGLGFILAMLGIMCYVWARLPLSSRIVTSVFAGFCIALGFAAIFAPVSFAPVNRIFQSPAMSSRPLPTLNEMQEQPPEETRPEARVQRTV
ncbi:hypothetical protein BDY19DRAFT_936879 [Irpex rosettiformis]|uniref:Uncharacterized protein n=1 Tax=Irpex rosettiformis TaxID=378272 RepID=A0ACB8U8Y8_9APHY|nr:hypothetical protein BDY19DRAFT_936879 [Irpex rosettiformis]